MAQEEALPNRRCIVEGYHLLREVLDGMNVTYRKNKKQNTAGDESQTDQSQSMPPWIVIAVRNILYIQLSRKTPKLIWLTAYYYTERNERLSNLLLHILFFRTQLAPSDNLSMTTGIFAIDWN